VSALALAVVLAPGTAPGQDDISAWNKIANSGDCAAYEDFLRRFPESKLRGMLKKRANKCLMIQMLLENPEAAKDDSAAGATRPARPDRD
jgi:hypothetical protein